MAQSTIIIDATVGGVNTNSFLSFERMEELIHQRPFHGDWDKINSDDEKKAALIWATRVLSRRKWDGLIATETQFLAFPRTGLYDFDSREYASDSYPDWLEIATSELTFNAATKNLLADSETAGFKALKLGSLALTVDTEYEKEYIPEYIEKCIAPWLSTEYGASSVQLGRV